mgnify:FL=1
MRVFALIAFVVGLIVAGQTFAQPATFAEVAGPWEGTNMSGTKITLHIEPSGKFTLNSVRGTEKGTAVLKDGTMNFSYIGGQTTMSLNLKEGRLVGTQSVGGRQPQNVFFNRSS